MCIRDRLIGHGIIMENGERLLNDDVLNGTVVMILFTCIISSVVTERAARKMVTLAFVTRSCLLKPL